MGNLEVVAYVRSLKCMKLRTQLEWSELDKVCVVSNTNIGPLSLLNMLSMFY